MIIDDNSSIKTYEYKHVECDVCYKKFMRSMGYLSWEGWECVSDFDPIDKTIGTGFGSLFDGDRLKVKSNSLVKIDNKLIDINKRYCICDYYIVYWIKNKLISYNDHVNFRSAKTELLKRRGYFC